MKTETPFDPPPLKDPPQLFPVLPPGRFYCFESDKFGFCVLGRQAPPHGCIEGIVIEGYCGHCVALLYEQVGQLDNYLAMTGGRLIPVCVSPKADRELHRWGKPLYHRQKDFCDCDRDLSFRKAER
jgi:hypothetical protein